MSIRHASSARRAALGARTGAAASSRVALAGRCGLSTATVLGPVPGAARTACCVVIGDEILNGTTLETNVQVLSRILGERGVHLRRVEVIPDEIDDIAATLRRVSPTVDAVFTSGGIGPTHDDVTYEGVAEAFSGGRRNLEVHQETVEKLKAHYAAGTTGAVVNAARLRMCTFPKGSIALSTPNLWVPLVNIQNVYILPGIPSLFERMMKLHAPLFGSPENAVARAFLFTDMTEGELASILQAALVSFPDVKLGSYPQSKRVKISLESYNEDQLARCKAFLAHSLGGTEH